MSITFYAAGIPAPQGSKRIGKNRRTGKAILIESSDAVKPWRKVVRAEALLAVRVSRKFPPIGPVAVSIEFVMPRPKKPTKPACDTRPDLDKLVRSTLDALTGALVNDDAQVVRLTASKRYARESGIENPGALITVTPIEVGVEIGPRVPAMDVTGGVG